MKVQLTLKALAAMAAVGLFGACSSDEDTPINPQYQISIAKQAEFKVEAGGHTIALSNLAARSLPGNPDLLYFKKANCPDLFRANFPDQVVPKAECEYVYSCIKADAEQQAAGNGPLYEVEKSSFTYKDFYIVNVHSSKDHDAKGDHSNVAGDMHDLGINGEYIKEFNTNTCVSADLIRTTEGLQQVTYDDSFGEKKQNYTVDDWKLYFIPDYGYYVGMDYHSAKEQTTGDGDFADWVIKLVPAVEEKVEVTETNGNVEVNLSVNDEHETGDYIATKLSIHIRSLSNVEVFIPVDKAYYCVADDMDVSLSHKDENVIYNTDPQYIETQIGGSTVKFVVEYEDEGIRISTRGVTKDVINYCAEEYADGVTFEVWNYFKNITRQNLKPMLDKATVSFTDAAPVVYVNAFAKVNGYSATAIYNKFNDAGQLVPYTDMECTQPLDPMYWTRETEDSKDYVFIGEPNPWDCTVTPSEAAYSKQAPDTEDKTRHDFNVTYTLSK